MIEEGGVFFDLIVEGDFVFVVVFGVLVFEFELEWCMSDKVMLLLGGFDVVIGYCG